jgi:hypothetical protein
MFDGNIADAPRLVSLPLELKGFGLAPIEIRSRSFARQRFTEGAAMLWS